jgi:hypothetical protein
MLRLGVDIRQRQRRLFESCQIVRFLIEIHKPLPCKSACRNDVYCPSIRLLALSEPGQIELADARKDVSIVIRWLEGQNLERQVESLGEVFLCNAFACSLQVSFELRGRHELSVRGRDILRRTGK